MHNYFIIDCIAYFLHINLLISDSNDFIEVVVLYFINNYILFHHNKTLIFIFKYRTIKSSCIYLLYTLVNKSSLITLDR